MDVSKHMYIYDVIYEQFELIYGIELKFAKDGLQIFKMIVQLVLYLFTGNI